MKEWRPVKVNPNYFVSNSGDVWNVSRGKMMIPRDNGNGYKKVCNLYIHRIVGEAFIPNPEGKPEINHKNGDKADNRVENLEWVTHQENQQHMFTVLDTPERKKRRCEAMSGKNNPMYGKPSANKGKPMSEDQKKKISIARKAYWQRIKQSEDGSSSDR